jgi:hypothetical protein
MATACVAAAALAGCGGSGTAASDRTTTTDSAAAVTGHAVCLQFEETDAARNTTPQVLSDAAADAIFSSLAASLRPATRKDPGAWSKLQKIADKLAQQLGPTSKASDDQIESTISKMAAACPPARGRTTTSLTVTTATPSTTG